MLIQVAAECPHTCGLISNCGRRPPDDALNGKEIPGFVRRSEPIAES